jgi:hypothetical protein
MHCPGIGLASFCPFCSGLQGFGGRSGLPGSPGTFAGGLARLWLTIRVEHVLP